MCNRKNVAKLLSINDRIKVKSVTVCSNLLLHTNSTEVLRFLYSVFIKIKMISCRHFKYVWNLSDVSVKTIILRCIVQKKPGSC